MEGLARLAKQLEATYPTSRRQQEWISHIELGGSQPTVNSGAMVETGLVMTSGDGAQVLQARIDGIRFSRLKPYATWGSFRAEAERLWSAYSSAFEPETVDRIAVRYINRVELPSPVDLKTYFRTGPEIAASLPQLVSQFFFRAVIPITPAITVVLTQMTEPASAAVNLLPIVIDIDASMVGVFSPSKDEMWKASEQLREVKNNCFFESFTEKGLELFAESNQ